MSDFGFSEEQLRDFVNEMPSGLALYLPNGEIAFCNKQARNILGISPGENHGLTLTNHLRQVVDANGSVLSSNDDPLSVAVMNSAPGADQLLGIRDYTGGIRWISLCATPRFDSANSVTAVLVTFSVVPEPDFGHYARRSTEDQGAPLHDSAKLGLWKWNFRTGQFSHDRGFSRLTRTSWTRSVDQWSQTVVEEDRLKFLLQFDLLEAGVPEVEFAYKSLRGNGSLHLFFVRATTTSASIDIEAEVEGSIIDITALLPGTLEVGELIDSMTDGYIAFDRNWLISFVNKRAERLLHLSSTDVVGTGIWDQFPSAYGSEIDRQLHLAMSGKHVTFDFRSTTGKTWFEVRAHPIPNGVAAYFRDITEQRNASEERERLLSLSEEAKERLAYAASHDTLTNLPNRMSLLSWIDTSLIHLEKNEKLAVLFIDLDRFKRVNDTHGHAEGDRVLIQVSQTLRNLVDPNARVSRLGGDEFVVAARVHSIADAQHMANDILGGLAKPITVSNRPLVVTASIGISISDDRSTAETLLRDADVALYAAKEQGRDRVRLFDNAIRQAVVTRLDTEADLRDAIRLDQISVHFQPIFDAATRRLNGFETLTRWFHREKGAIPPEIFISVAEESGLILPLGEYLIDSVLETLPHLGKNADDQDRFTVWINVSSRQLEDFSFVNHLITSYQGNCRPGQLGIQLTESVLSRESPETYSVLYSLAGRGIKIAIDDFGKGYSSLSRLVDYPVDLIILDRSLVEELSTSSGSSLVPALVNLAHAINAKVCASGIETQHQLHGLLNLGVDLVSGYYLGYPQPIERIAESIALGKKSLSDLSH